MQFYWGMFSGDEPVKEKKGKTGERKKLTLSVAAVVASADRTGSVGVSMDSQSCPKLSRGARPLYPCIRSSLAMGYS